MDTVGHWAKAAGAAEVRVEVMEFNREAMGFYDAVGYRATAALLV